jgi:hypothetical protein
MIRKFLVTLGILTLVPFQASALSVPTQQITQVACSSTVNAFFMIQPWYSCLPKDQNGNPKFTKLTDLFLVIFSLVESLVKVAAYVAVGVIFFMLIKMMVARGDTGKIASAGLGIRDALIGLVIALSSVAIINFVSGAFK